MGFGDVPVTELRGLVVVQAQVDPQADLAAGERFGVKWKSAGAS